MIRRVLHVMPDLVPYGLENVVAGLVRLLDRRRFQSAVVSLYPEAAGGLEPSLRAIGIPIFHLDKKRGLDLRMYTRLRRVVREYRPHILHTHNYVLRYAYPVAVATGIRTVVHTVHNVADREVDQFGVRLQKYAFRHGVAAVTIADEVSASFRRVYGYSEAALIPNSVPVEQYRHPAVPRAVWRAANGIPESDFVYVSVARFAEQKDHATMLAAFRAGPSNIPGTRLLLAGDGELREEVERRVTEYGLGDRVTFLGRRTDIPDVLGAADAFVMSSRWEGNPLAVMEAMAAGRPAVATLVGAVPELVRNGVDGMLVPPGDAQGMGQVMCLLAERREMAAEMGRSAAARALEKFDLPAMVRAYTALYDRVAPESASGGARKVIRAVGTAS